MATEVLQSCVVLCRFFWEQKQLNDEAKDAVSALGCYVKRLLPPLQSLDPRSVANAIGVLSNLQNCLNNSQRIFAKYKTGWKSGRFWVTPAQIKAKAKAQEERTRHAWYDLSVVLNIQGHNALHPSAPSAVETKPDDTFELPAGAVVVDRKRNNLPTTVLGQGSFGIVGLGSLKSGDGSTAPVAVKMAMPNVLAAADSQPQIVEEWRREVRFLATIEHPNIVQCYGCVTREEGELSLWIVMEKLDITLSSAINDKHLQVGRNNPQTYVELVAGICSAMAYLHTPINGNPVVHRDVKPENIMLNNLSDCVVKLVDFGLAKETVRSGVGSTMNVKGTREWMAPEQLTDGGCSVSSDMYAAGLVAAFIWSGLTPDQSPVAQIKVEETADPRAKFTQQLMLQCLNRVPNNRPAAAFVSFQLENFAPPPAPAPAGAPTQASAEASVAGVGFLALIGIDDPADGQKLLASGVRSHRDLLELELDDITEMTQNVSLSISTKKTLKKFVQLSPEEKKLALEGSSAAAPSAPAASSPPRPQGQLCVEEEPRTKAQQEEREAFRRAIGSEKDIETLVRGMDTYLSDPAIQEEACRRLQTLGNLGKKVEIANLGGIQAILTAMKEQGAEAKVQEQACGTLRSLAINDDNAVTIAALQGIEALLKAMKEHATEAKVQEMACTALFTLASNPGFLGPHGLIKVKIAPYLLLQNKALMKREGGEEVVRTAMAAANATNWTKKKGQELLDELAQC